MAPRINHDTEAGKGGKYARWANAAAAEPDTWHQLTEDEADYCLGVLPPIYFDGGFAVSEEAHADAEGRPHFYAVVRVRAVFYGRHLHRGNMAREARALRDALEAGAGVKS